jgi:hypothetical protein
MSSVEVASVDWTQQADVRRSHRLALLLFAESPTTTHDPVDDAAPEGVGERASSPGVVGATPQGEG